MVVVLDDPSGLGQGISAFGQAIGAGLQRRGDIRRQEAQQQQQKQEQQQYGSVMGSVLGQLPENPSAMDVSRAFTTAVSQGVPVDVAQNMTTLYSTLAKSQREAGATQQEIDKFRDILGRFGFSEENADAHSQLYGSLTTGGRTQYATMLLDQIQRGDVGGPPSANPLSDELVEQTQQTMMMPDGVPGESQVITADESATFEWPKFNIFEGMTGKERASLKRDLLKENNKELKEIQKQIDSSEGNQMRLDQLETLNQSGQLPEGWQRFLINWNTGDSPVPQLLNPETQLYIKTVNDFLVGAKDTFGGRVTNFELNAFKKRLPTLANTTEGRSLILAQMKNMQQLDRLRNDALKEVYRKYGTQNIDRAKAEEIADKLIESDLEQLKEDNKNIIQRQEDFFVKQQTPSGMIPVQKPDGSRGYVREDQGEAAEKKGWKLL